jgi:hypothetical protein
VPNKNIAKLEDAIVAGGMVAREDRANDLLRGISNDDALVLGVVDAVKRLVDAIGRTSTKSARASSVASPAASTPEIEACIACNTGDPTHDSAAHKARQVERIEKTAFAKIFSAPVRSAPGDGSPMTMKRR